MAKPKPTEFRYVVDRVQMIGSPRRFLGFEFYSDALEEFNVAEDTPIDCRLYRVDGYFHIPGMPVYTSPLVELASHLFDISAMEYVTNWK